MSQDRRQFLSAALAAAPMFVPRSAWGANDRLAYGLIEAMVTAYLGSVYTQIVAFTVVILALAFLPNGLMGRAAVNKV